MEKEPKNDVEIKTEAIQAGLLNNKDIIFINSEEFDVIDVDHQQQNSYIKVKRTVR